MSQGGGVLADMRLQSHMKYQDIYEVSDFSGGLDKDIQRLLFNFQYRGCSLTNQATQLFL